jgi:hypothetical protein
MTVDHLEQPDSLRMQTAQLAELGFTTASDRFCQTNIESRAPHSGSAIG